ncbi:hypothetical protein ABZ915_17635 [Streptomyces sp. NPDC046915]|uniref:hypothetical protein n=1 Tax=Streptomyces sp. NPDC046915 TaxID=3155257 RepID=UPI0033C31A64
MTEGHRAYVSSTGRGNGRYSYTFKCTCGRQGGSYGSNAAATAAARKHEGRGQ